MVDKTKYFTKMILIVFIIFLFAFILGIYFEKFNLFSWIIVSAFIFIFYKQYKFLKINYNFKDKKVLLIFLILSILVILSNYIFIQSSNKTINFICNIVFYSTLPLSSIIFNNIESKLK